MQRSSSRFNKNPYLRFYGEHRISPVHQDIGDFEVHLSRREKLYRQLGLPVAAFENKDILEVGSGGGHNALAFFQWGARVDFVEPNPIAQDEIPLLLKKYNIPEQRWRLFKGMVEDYRSDRQYSIVIAEGFIPCIPNKRQVITKLTSLVKPGGVAVATCTDDISFFFEYLKRIIAFRLMQTMGAGSFRKNVKMLAEAFSSHLRSLKYASRPIEDWVIDNLMNPAKYGDFFSIADCISMFGDGFELLGSSPQMFMDSSWYKDYRYNSKREIIRQFLAKRHILLRYGLGESSRSWESNNVFWRKTREIRILVENNDHCINKRVVSKLLVLLSDAKRLISGIDRESPKAIDEVKALLRDSKLCPEKVAKAKSFAAAFGRGQQYVSMMNKFTLFR